MINDYTTSRVHLIFKMAEIRSLFGLFLVHKRNTKSSIWQNFGHMATEGGKVIEKKRNQFVELVVKASTKAAIPQIFSSIHVNTTHKYILI